jgi:hypothetical protein
MSDDTGARFSGQSVRPAGEPLKPAQIHELRRLYDLLAITTASAADALGKAGLPTASAFERFRALDDGVREIFARINTISP